MRGVLLILCFFGIWCQRGPINVIITNQYNRSVVLVSHTVRPCLLVYSKYVFWKRRGKMDQADHFFVGEIEN